MAAAPDAHQVGRGSPVNHGHNDGPIVPRRGSFPQVKDHFGFRDPVIPKLRCQCASPKRSTTPPGRHTLRHSRRMAPGISVCPGVGPQQTHAVKSRFGQRDCGAVRAGADPVTGGTEPAPAYRRPRTSPSEDGRRDPARGSLLTACRTSELSRADGNGRETDTLMKVRTCRHHGLVVNRAHTGPGAVLAPGTASSFPSRNEPWCANICVST